MIALNGRYQTVHQILTHYRRQILDSSKLKEFADDNFKFDENGRKLSKLVQNTVGKGEIACDEQLFLFPQCFPWASKGVVVWEWVKITGMHGKFKDLSLPSAFFSPWYLSSMLLRSN